MREKSSLWQQISTAAFRQQGYIKREHLLALGVGRAAIAYRVSVGELIRRHAGVYAVGHIPPGPIPDAAAAVLACGDEAALSHASAAALWGFGRWPSIPEVTAPRERRRPGIRTHRSQTLTRHDVTQNYGIPVTTAVRTICDIAPRLTDDALLKAVDDARIAGALGPDATNELTGRCARLRGLVGTNATRSAFERAWRRFAARYPLPAHELNPRVCGFEVDVYFPGHRLIVELDGYRFHRGPRSFRSDRLRDTILKDHRIDTVRLTTDRLTADEHARLLRILGNQPDG